MKKIFLFLMLSIGIKSYSQDLSGITVNLTIRAGDWGFFVGYMAARGNASDSSFIVNTNRLRDTMLVANPATFNTNVRFNSISATVVYKIYTTVKSIPSTLYDQVGTNIATQIKAISNTPLQTALTNFDNLAIPVYTDIRKLGKNFLSDH